MLDFPKIFIQSHCRLQSFSHFFCDAWTSIIAGSQLSESMNFTSNHTLYYSKYLIDDSHTNTGYLYRPQNAQNAWSLVATVFYYILLCFCERLATYNFPSLATTHKYIISYNFLFRCVYACVYVCVYVLMMCIGCCRIL